MSYFNTLKNGLVICSSRPEHALQLEKLQDLVFPTLASAEHFREHHYLKHIELFPEGQFVALDTDRVVGMTAEEYYEKLQEGKITDPTLTPQMKIGFELQGLLPGYLNDPVCANYGVLIVLEAGKEISPE